MSIVQSTWFPVFGMGAPDASVPHSAMYFDASTTPYTPYTYHGGGWHSFGTSSGGANASAIQGVPVNATAPLNGQALIYDGTEYVPTTPSSGSVPVIVQDATTYTASHATGITLGAAPTAGNLLVALVSDIPGAPSPATGWVQITAGGAAQDGWGILWKVAGAGESATQTPCSDTHSGTISMYEISNAATGATEIVPGYAGTVVTENGFNQKPTSALIIGVFVNRSGTVAPSSITGTGVVADAVHSDAGGGRTSANFHVANPVQGTTAVTANYATSQGGIFISCGIG
jgi:hypothetical protein